MGHRDLLEFIGCEKMIRPANYPRNTWDGIAYIQSKSIELACFNHIGRSIYVRCDGII